MKKKLKYIYRLLFKMKKTAFTILVFLLNFSGLMAQQASQKMAFLEKWENSKNYLIAVAEAMPENAYDFKPTERQMSFKEQLMHIKENMEWLSTTCFTKIEYKKEDHSLPTTKVETIAALEKAFNLVSEIIKKTPAEDFTKTVKFFAGPKSKLQILALLQDHVTHHRGQLIVYLNLNKVKPPNYIGW